MYMEENIMEKITEKELMKLVKNGEIDENELDIITGGRSELGDCIKKCVDDNKGKDNERLRTLGCIAKQCFLPVV